jgi:hypothetical protein
MWALLRKNSGFFLFYIAIYFGFLFPMINYDRFQAAAPLSLGFVFFITTYIYWLVLGAVYSHEQLEHKNNGYAFLRNLPISRRDLVLSKYILVFLSVLIYISVQYIWLGSIFPDPGDTATARAYVLINSSFCLVLAGWFYALIFRYGFGKFGKILLVSWILLLISPILILTLILPKLGLTRMDIILFLTKTDPLAAFTFSFVLFSASYLAALKFFGREYTQG